MRFALSVPPFCAPGEVVALARDAEAAGWDGFFLWDHLRFDADARPEVHNPWVLLGAIAQVTSSMVLGPLVTPLARRRPWQLAKEVTTLDHLSGGRAALGVGVGEPSGADFADEGDPGDRRERAAVLDEGLELLAALLAGGPVEHRGERFQVASELVPPPVQRPRPPIWVAARVPYRRPLARAHRWDGIAPIGPGPDGTLTPDEVHDYLGGDVPTGWDVLAPWGPGHPAADYEGSGATWLVESTWPTGDWLPEFRSRVRAGPRR